MINHSINQEESINKKLFKILKDISPYVIVTGSYANGNYRETSDIDFYVKPKYFYKLVKYFEDNNYKIDYYVNGLLFFIGSYQFKKSLDFCTKFDIDLNNIFEINIMNVKMKASISTYVKEAV